MPAIDQIDIHLSQRPCEFGIVLSALAEPVAITLLKTQEQTMRYDNGHNLQLIAYAGSGKFYISLPLLETAVHLQPCHRFE